MTKERGNHDYIFSPLTDADSPARCLLKVLLWLQAVFAGIEEEMAKEEKEVVEANRTSVGSGSCEKGEKMKRGREGGRKDGAEEVAQTLKAGSVVVSRELEMGGARHAEEESRSWEADGMGMMKGFSADARVRQPEKCESARAHQLIRAELPSARPSPRCHQVQRSSYARPRYAPPCQTTVPGNPPRFLRGP